MIALKRWMKLVSSPNKVHDILVYALSLHPCVHVRYRKILNKVLNQLLIPFYQTTTTISKTKDKSRKTKSSVYCLISILTWDELLSTLCPFSRLVTETILGLRRFCIATVYSEIGSLVAAQLCNQSHCNGAGALAATTSKMRADPLYTGGFIPRP